MSMRNIQYEYVSWLFSSSSLYGGWHLYVGISHIYLLVYIHTAFPLNEWLVQFSILKDTRTFNKIYRWSAWNEHWNRLICWMLGNWNVLFHVCFRARILIAPFNLSSKLAIILQFPSKTFFSTCMSVVRNQRTIDEISDVACLLNWSIST